MSPIVEAFSISHAAILDGTTGAEVAAIYGVRDGTLDIDTDSFNNAGDDKILSVWNWFNLANLNLTSGFMSWDMYSLISGATITSSGIAPNDYWNVPLWNQSALNQSTRPFLLRAPAKLAPTQGGTPRSLDFVLYRVQPGLIKFDGPANKAGLTFSFSGQALISDVDERGVALPEPAFGRLVVRPRI